MLTTNFCSAGSTQLTTSSVSAGMPVGLKAGIVLEPQHYLYSSLPGITLSCFRGLLIEKFVIPLIYVVATILNLAKLSSSVFSPSVSN